MSPYIYVDESSDVPFGKYIKRYHEHDANQDISLSYLNLSPSISICSRLNNCGCRKIHKLAIFQLDHSTWVGRPLIKKTTSKISNVFSGGDISTH